MGIIHILDTELSNKIAAGEVVERPASVIKELVENSIDAGATHITVEIRDGGITYMRVTDNGSGMTCEDAKIAFLRHATSKIQTDNDLDAIYTLGFRGEALSSIAAVACVDLFTKTAEAPEGVLVHAQGGEITMSDSAATPTGTTIVVKNLFFNTPARMKFLKKNSTEAGYIGDIMSRFVLAHPEISFKFINSNKEQLFSSGNSRLEDCIYTVYGKEYAKAAIEVCYEGGGVCVSGAVGKGEVSRPNRNFQSFFVNGRYIKSPLIIRAVEEAYKNQVMIGKFPMAILNIKIDPSLIDINVHPTKLEVKFSDEKLIYETVYFGVRNALYKTVNIPKIEAREDIKAVFDGPSRDSYSQAVFGDIKGTVRSVRSAQNMPSAERTAQNAKDSEGEPSAERTAQNVQESEGEPTVRNVQSTAAVARETIAKKAARRKDENAQEEPPKAETPKAEPIDYYKRDFVPQPIDFSALGEDMHRLKAAQDVAEYCVDEPEKDGKNAPRTFLKDKPPVNEYTIVGQIFDTYIIVERADEMLIIDQHAAHERIKYEQLKANCANGKIAPQLLLAPVIVRLSPAEMAVYCENTEFFGKLGLETDEFGDNSIVVRTIPAGVECDEVNMLIVELISQLAASKREPITEKEDRAMYTVACKAAVKANHRLHHGEMAVLLRDIFALDNINTCPHGRPIIVSMTKKELEKEFKRIV